MTHFSVRLSSVNIKIVQKMRAHTYHMTINCQRSTRMLLSCRTNLFPVAYEIFSFNRANSYLHEYSINLSLSLSPTSAFDNVTKWRFSMLPNGLMSEICKFFAQNLSLSLSSNKTHCLFHIMLLLFFILF